LGGIGAEVAARAAVDFLKSTTVAGREDDELRSQLVGALKAAREAVLAAAEQRSAAPRDLATTLIVLAPTNRRVAAAQVGDGAAVYADAGGRLQALTRPSADEYINETTFVTSDGWLEAAQIEVSPRGVTRVAAFTDGLQRLALKMPSGDPHPPFFAPLFHFVAQTEESSDALKQLEVFLQSPRIVQREDDDLTLLLAARVDAAGEAA
jgi:hypothetical protein